MTIKEHYDNHLGNFYSWMVGDMKRNQSTFHELLLSNGIKPYASKVAVDLGAAHGIQCIPLAKMGYDVI